MLDHKRDYCKLRFTCKCDVLNEECTSCDISAADVLMNLNCNQGIQGDTTSEAAPNISTSSKTDSETTSLSRITTSQCRGKMWFNFYLILST